eukprot:9471439-Pyramimonas_sp.AAC.1
MAAQPAAPAWRSCRGRKVEWTESDVKATAEKWVELMGPSVVNAVKSRKGNGNACVVFKSGKVGGICHEDVERNAFWIHGVLATVKNAAFVIPSGFQMADSFIALHNVLGGKLFKPADPKQAEVREVELRTHAMKEASGHLQFHPSTALHDSPLPSPPSPPNPCCAAGVEDENAVLQAAHH